jgi:hypothetical protein
MGALVQGTWYGMHVNTQGFGSMQIDTAAVLLTADDPTDEITIKTQHAGPPIGGPSKLYKRNQVEDHFELKGAGNLHRNEVLVPFTMPADGTIYRASFWISRMGTVPPPSGDPVARVRAKIRADTGGTPGDEIGSESIWISPINIRSGLTKITFNFLSADVNLSADTDYWLAFDVSYTDDATPGFFRVHGEKVDGTSGCKYLETGWFDLPNLDIWFETEYLQYVDVPDALAPAVTYVAGDQLNLELTRQDINLDLLGDFVRPKFTVSAGSWWVPVHLIIMGDSFSRPPGDAII